MTDTNTLVTRLQHTKSECDDEKNNQSVELEPYLVILSGLDQGKQFRLSLQFNCFGRSSNVDIKLFDEKISRNHGMLIIYPDRIVLEDLQSTNGTYVDEILVESQVIEANSRIRVGNTEMKVEYKKASEVDSDNALYEAANTDVLTNILNRRAFMIRAQEEVSYCKRNNGQMAIVMCDVDHFKKTNDNFGHLAGDQMLRELAKILHAEMREHDVLARYGGEEFIMLLRSTDPSSVREWAERIREKVDQFDFYFEGFVIPTTLSFGICNKNGDDITSLDAIIKIADNALYKAKNNGRNRVEMI